MIRWRGATLKKILPVMTTAEPPWRSLVDTLYSIRRVTRILMDQEGVGAWTAFKMLRRYAIIHGHWPTPVKRKLTATS